MSKPRPRLALVLATLALLLTGWIVLGVHSLGYRGMWWDEAAQFWVSQGLGNYSPPFAERRGLYDVGRMNALENLDPGGFSVLLHVWTACGLGLPWLRSLPFAFFILGAAGLGVLGWRLTHSGLFAVAAGAVTSLYPAALYFGLEIRAYSMEMAGVAVGAVALMAALERPSSARASLLGVVCAVFLTSRYSYALVAFALLFAFWRGGARVVHGRELRLYLCAAAVPVLVTGAAIGWIMLRHQVWTEMRRGPFGIVSPLYTRASVVSFGADRSALIMRNLFSLPALPITVGALVLALAHLRKVRRIDDRDPDRDGRRSGDTYTPLYTFVVALQAISAFVSLLGLYPWDIGSRWSAYLVMLSAVAVVALAAQGRSLVPATLGRRSNADRPASRAFTVGAALAVLIVAVAAGRSALHRQSVESARVTNVALQIDLLPRTTLPPGSVFVSFYEAPALRYLYEHGPYAGSPEYPRLFRFESRAEWVTRAPIAAWGNGLSFIVSAQSAAELQQRFPGCSVRTYGPQGSRLLAVSTVSGLGGHRQT